MNVFAGSTCPLRDLSCVTSDGSNVITSTIASDDAECGGKFIIIKFTSLLGQKEVVLYAFVTKDDLINSLQNSAMKIYSASTGNPPITPMKMRTTVELGSSTALCSTAANPGAPVQNTQLSPTVDTDPASPTPSNAARAQHVHSVTPADLSATGGVSLTITQQQHVSLERAPPPPTSSCREPRVHSLLWRQRRMNAVDNVRTSPPTLELPPASPVLQAALTSPVKMSVEQLVGIVEDPYWKSGVSVPHLTSVQLP